MHNAVGAPSEAGMGRTGNVVSRNPNASVALTSGSGVGALIVWLVGLSGTPMPPEVAAIVASAVASVVLFVGPRGLKGTLKSLWGGTGG